MNRTASVRQRNAVDGATAVRSAQTAVPERAKPPPVNHQPPGNRRPRQSAAVLSGLPGAVCSEKPNKAPEGPRTTGPALVRHASGWKRMQ